MLFIVMKQVYLFMLSKFFKQLLIGTALVCSTVYSMDHMDGMIPVPHVVVGSDRVTFQGVNPVVGGGNQWYLDQLIQQVQTPNWNGVLVLPWGQLLDAMNADDLRRLGEAIQNLPIMAGRITIFAPSVAAPTAMDMNRREVRIATFDATLEVPFVEIGAEELQAIFRVPYGELIFSGAKRAVRLAQYHLPARTFGTTWKFLGDFIKHYSAGMQEVALLMEDKGIGRMHDGDQTPEFKRLIVQGLAALQDASDAWNILNAEFEKRSQNPDAEKIRNAEGRLQHALEFLFGFLGYAGGIDTPIRIIINFLQDVPGDKKFEAFMNCRGGFGNDHANVPAAQETTAEMLDRLLTKKPNKELVVAVEGSGPGLVKTIRLGGNRLWNVTKLDDPHAAQLQENARNRGGWQDQYNGMDWNFNQTVVQPCEAQFLAIVKELNLKDGSYTMVMRVPDAGRHVFRILGFRVRHDAWDPQTGMNTAARVSLEKYIGFVEITEARDGDRTMPMYDPMRTHGLDSIRGTMMEQRIHEAMAEHRVHQFGMLPEGVRNQLKEEVTAYNQQRHQTRLDNQGLGQYALTPEETRLSDDLLAERLHAYNRVHDAYTIHGSVPARLHAGIYSGQAYDERLHNTAQNRAAKLSAELTDRLAIDRALRMRTHGDDLTVNPEQHLRVHGRVRVHELFDAERNHHMRNVLSRMSPREREFFGGNKSGGYLDTVETEMATQQVHFDPTSGPVGVHGRLHGGDRMHADRLQPGKYGVSAGLGRTLNAGPTSPYTNIQQALDDYDLGGYDDDTIKDRFEERQGGADGGGLE